jgi:cell division septation protein DedD
MAFLTVAACAPQTGPRNETSTRLVVRDVEAPDIFQVTEPGIWDGAMSLNGVWVAHPEAANAERVLIRNAENGRFVIGALFKRGATGTGPRLQISSDTASALKIVSSQPTNLMVTALRREETDGPQIDAASPALSAPETVETAALVAPVTTSPTEAPIVSRPAPQATSLAKPFIQIGLFSVQANANKTAQLMRSAGMTPTIDELSSSGKTFWRVTVGPAANAIERAGLLKKITAQGFEDAFYVSK